MKRRKPGLRTAVLSLPFLFSVLVLAAAAMGRMGLLQWGNIVPRKAAVALRKPLSALDKSRLGDYRFERKNDLTAAVESALGTDQYLDWMLTDTSVPGPKDPRRYVHLFITYYTGGSNLVPHMPDVCYIGGGYQAKQAHETRFIDVPALGAAYRSVPIRVCTFFKTAIFAKDEPTVIYTFHANGAFTASQTGVRNLTHRISDRYAYFSKVEVSFGGKQCQPQNLGREESIAAAAKLFQTVLPVLVEEHWPDWEALAHSPPEEGSGT